MIKFRHELQKDAIIEALSLIARGETSDLAANPLAWSSTVAYLAMGGRISEGRKLDMVEELEARLKREL